jgi:hypothetical protein
LLSAIPKPDPLSEKNRVRKVYNPSKAHDYSKQKPTFREILPGHWILCNDAEEEKYHAEKAKEAAKAEALLNAKRHEETPKDDKTVSHDASKKNKGE